MKFWNKKIVGTAFLLLLGACLFFSLLFFRNSVSDNFLSSIAPYSQGLIYRFGVARSFIEEILKINNLVEENIALRGESERMMAEIADKNRLEEEVYNLRRIIDLSLPDQYRKTEGGVFSIQFSPEGHSALLNKGEADKVSVGDIIISPSGILIGTIGEVYENYSRIMLVTDPDFKATARTYSGVSAIARGAINDGLYLDFISNSDEIKDGDIISTDGNDLLPPGLLIGIVESIQNDGSGLFKKVTVRPQIREINLGMVVILSPEK